MKRVTGVYSAEEWRKLGAEIESRDETLGLLWRVGSATGYRVSDLLKMRVGEIRRMGLIEAREMKTGKIRQVALPKRVYEAVNVFKTHFKLTASDYLFGEKTNRGKPISRQKAHKVFREAGESVGMQGIGTHTMRKTYAWNTLVRERDFGAVQEAMKHTYMSTTFGYLKDGLIRTLPEQGSCEAGKVTKQQ